MDHRQFDDLTRSFAVAGSRRGLVRAAVSALLGGALAAFGVRDTDAQANVRRCMTRRRGQNVPVPDGTRCGQCGTCVSGACFAQEGTCGPCAECDGATARCVPRNEGGSCGGCGECQGGRCRPQRSRCVTGCERCRASGDVLNCQSICDADERCCPEGTCRGQNACCQNERRCTDGSCCTHECCGTTCCPEFQNGVAKKCCGVECCDADDACNDDGTCCPNPCPIPGTDERRCCDSSFCCLSTGTCVSSSEVCCQQCDPCQSCDPNEGVCRDEGAREGARCELPGVTGPCDGICRNSRCTRVQVNERCADGAICCNQGCCDSTTQTCCGGQCCNGTCCNGECCEGLCIANTFCCPTPGFAAADAELCCPFGPPCGEGDAARCCEENQACCGGACCAEGAFCCGGVCCPAGDTCENDVCREACAPGETPCGGACCDIGTVCCDGVCCAFLESCTSNGCCPNSERCPASGGPPEEARCCFGDGGTAELCVFDFVSPAACCPGPVGPNGEGGHCGQGCCANGLVCDNSCLHHLGDDVGCCHEFGLNPVPLTCENLQCRAPVSPS